jgi:hypothetical protein
MFNHMDNVESQRMKAMELVSGGKGGLSGKGKVNEPFMEMVDDAIRDSTIEKFLALKQAQHLKNEEEEEKEAGDPMGLNTVAT